MRHFVLICFLTLCTNQSLISGAKLSRSSSSRNSPENIVPIAATFHMLQNNAGQWQICQPQTHTLDSPEQIIPIINAMQKEVKILHATQSPHPKCMTLVVEVNYNPMQSCLTKDTNP